MEGALQLEVRTVPLVLSLRAQRVRLLATHRVVPARELQQPRHLRADRLRLRKLFEDFVLTTLHSHSNREKGTAMYFVLTCSIPKFLSSAIGDRHVGQ